MSDDRPPTEEYDRDRDHAGDDVRAATDRERTTDAVDRERTDRETASAAARGDERTGESATEQRGDTDDGPASAREHGDGGGNGDGRGAGGHGGGRSDRIAFWVSVLIGLALSVGAIALVSNRAPFFEDVLRIRPTVEGGGIGADWIVGNTGPILDLAITLVHLADVVMGIFILLMVFIHWAAFRRLATRMRPPAGSARARESAAATDGGVPDSRSEDGIAGDSSDRADDPSTGTGGGPTRGDGGDSGDGADGGDRP